MPHDPHLSVHVKAHGIWTWKLRQKFDPTITVGGAESGVPNPMQTQQPKLRIEGPFGGGNQDWYKFEVAVMVGAGMGVTPYASILKDLVCTVSSSSYQFSVPSCEKGSFFGNMLLIPARKERGP